MLSNSSDFYKEKFNLETTDRIKTGRFEINLLVVAWDLTIYKILYMHKPGFTENIIVFVFIDISYNTLVWYTAAMCWKAIQVKNGGVKRNVTKLNSWSFP